MENNAQTTQDTIEYYKERNEKLEIEKDKLQMEKEALEAKLKWYEEQFRLSQQRSVTVK
ncbi:hypothetical protein B4064_3288 [Caldibacillus thermoamylovorans]|uniref:hypothetical protein n=1 Tax=Caldifermentibacillus hisashii TaxID=996558 RepID=UPI0005B6BE2F|nr:hypothetical protein B4064_3288 [Caldibacillus thermoamylovorans]